MLQPNLTTRGTLAWQVANQTLNVLINTSNANKSSPLGAGQLAGSFALAVSASCGVAVGLGRVVGRLKVGAGTKLLLGRLVPFAAVASAGVLNVALMRGGEIQNGIDVYPAKAPAKGKVEIGGEEVQKESLGKSRKAAVIAVAETAVSRVLNATPIMVIPPLVLVRLQRSAWMKRRPGLQLPVNIGMAFYYLLSFPRQYGKLMKQQASSLRPPYLPSLLRSVPSRSARPQRLLLSRRNSGIRAARAEWWSLTGVSNLKARRNEESSGAYLKRISFALSLSCS